MDLDEIFENYDDKKNEKEEVEEKERQEVTEAKNAGLEVLQNIVEPTFEEICGQINSKGHKAEIKKGYTCALHPRIELKFHIVSKKEGSTYIPDSTIEFRHQEKDSLKVTKEINTRNGKASNHMQGSHSLTPFHKTITPEWVRKVTLEFVKAALDAN